MELHPDDACQFRLSFPDADAGLAVVDVSGGGIGLQSEFFIPRNIRMTIQVQVDSGAGPRAFRVPVTSRRCKLIDHKPTYLVGMQFFDAAGEDEQALVRAIRRPQTPTAVDSSEAGAGDH